MSTGVRLARHEDLLEPLGEAGDRDLVGQPEPAHDPLGDAQLALAAVDEQAAAAGSANFAGRVPGSGGGSSLVGEVRGEPAGQHLFHRRVVVVARHVRP